MDTLSAVNELLASLGDPPVDALNTTTDDQEAQSYLARWQRRVLCEQAWCVLVEEEVVLTVADRSFATGGVTGAYQYDETVTQTGTGATGTFAYLDGSTVYLRYVSGTFNGTGVLTGGTSGATSTPTTVTTITESKIPVDATNWLRVFRSRKTEWKDIVARGGYFYNLADNTYTFTSSITVDIVKLAAFPDLPEALAFYVVQKATWAWQQYKQRGDVDENMIEKRLAMAQAEARKEDLDLRGRNHLNTAEARRIRGARVELQPIGHAGAW